MSRIYLQHKNGDGLSFLQQKIAAGYTKADYRECLELWHNLEPAETEAEAYLALTVALERLHDVAFRVKKSNQAHY